MALEEPSWLNNQFIEKILKQSENDDSIRVLNIVTKPATNKGDNYMSQMHRTVVNYTRNQGPRQITENKSLVIKAILPEGPQHELIKEIGLFDVEIKMMTTTLRDMQRLLNDTKLSGKCLYTQYDNPLAMLVIEDLAPLGFRMADREAGLDLQHCILAIRGLAKFHASSVAVCEKVPKYKEQYNRGIFNTANPMEFQKCFVGAMKTLGNAIQTWPELDKQYADKIMNIAEKAYGRASEARIVDNSEFNVINHGDYWVNNMLFRYNDKGNVIDHIFVDFQLCVYGSPAIDLLYFLNTSPSDEVLGNHRSTLIAEYLKVLFATMQKIGCTTTAPTMNELKHSIQKREIYGFVAASTILPIVLVNKDDAPDLEEIMNSGETEVNNKAYANEAYRKTMARRLPYWDELGLFNV